VPLVAGKVSTVDPDTAGAAKVTDPLVSPYMTTLLIIYFLILLTYKFNYNCTATTTRSISKA
jgi:hypothetical protein